MLTQRDRVITAAIIRAFIARDIDRRGIKDTYHPALLGVNAFELIELADELLHCIDGDNVELAQDVAQVIAFKSDEDGRAASEVEAGDMPEHSELRKLDATDRAEVEAERARHA